MRYNFSARPTVFEIIKPKERCEYISELRR
jgi:hypothetical protein